MKYLADKLFDFYPELSERENMELAGLRDMPIVELSFISMGCKR